MGAGVLTDKQIASLLGVRKVLISTSNPKPRTKAQHQEWEYVLNSESGETFFVYARQSLLLGDAFSCGLRWVSPGGDVMLMRANGSNHVHPNRLEKTKISQKCHVHIATERYGGAGMAIEAYAEESSEYTDLRGALLALGRLCNIEGQPFEAPPQPPQMNLFGPQV